MVSLINPIYTLYSGFLLGIIPFKGLILAGVSIRDPAWSPKKIEGQQQAWNFGSRFHYPQKGHVCRIARNTCQLRKFWGFLIESPFFIVFMTEKKTQKLPTEMVSLWKVIFRPNGSAKQSPGWWVAGLQQLGHFPLNTMLPTIGNIPKIWNNYSYGCFRK